MTLQERIYVAIEKWKCSYQLLGFLFNLEPDKIEKTYHEEKIKRLPTITIDAQIECLGLSSRAENCLKRMQIRTIRQLLTYTKRFSDFWGCGEQTDNEIHDAIKTIQSVLKLSVQDLIAAFRRQVNITVDFMDDTPNYNKPMKSWAYTKEIGKDITISVWFK